MPNHRKMGTVKIAYTPCQSENSYTQRMVEILSGFCEVTELPGRKALLQRLVAGRRLDAIILNWTDNAFVTKEGAPCRYQFVRALLNLVFYRLAAHKVIFVRHNVYPHHTAAPFREQIRRWVDLYERFASLSWVHSQPLASERRAFIPFPLYTFGHLRPAPAEPADRFVLFGRILPYKDIHGLLKVLDPEVKLLVCGSASDARYLAEIQRLARGNVEIRPGFVSDENAAGLVRHSRGMVVSNSDGDMIVSASIMFALSLGTPVYCLRSPYVDWLSRELACPLLHAYDSLDELATALRSPEEDLPGSARWGELFSDESIRERMQATLRGPAANRAVA